MRQSKGGQRLYSWLHSAFQKICQWRATQLSHITPQRIDDFQRFPLTTPKDGCSSEGVSKQSRLSPTTAYDYSKVIRMALRKAVRENILMKNPAEGVKGLPETDLIFLSVDEAQKLADADLGGELGAEIKKAFIFACHTGLRISDIKSLKWGGVERDPMRIIKRQEKTRRAVFIPLSDIAWSIIDDGDNHNPDDKVFRLLANTKSQTNQYLLKWASLSGVTKPVGWRAAGRRSPHGSLSKARTFTPWQNC